MMSKTLSAPGNRQWLIAGAAALAGHVVIGALALTWVKPAQPLPPEPVVLVELAEEASASAQPVVAQAQAQPVPQPAMPTPVTPPPVDAPQVRAPLPQQALVLPAPAQPVRTAQPAPPTPTVAPAAQSIAASGSGAGTSTAPGADARARAQEIDYFSLVSAHLNRRKTYPAEAKKARQQGVVTVRFTVDRNGAVTGAAIKRSSGHAILDSATLDLLARVAPLPRMPSSMKRERVTLSLPIDYSLRTS